MKKVILSTIALFLCVSVFAQNREMNKFFDGLEESESYATVKVNKEMFQLLAAMNGDSESTELKELVRDLDEITVLINENGGDSDYNKFQSLVKRHKLNSYMSIKDEGSNVNLYSGGTTDDGKLKGMVLSVRADTQTVFIHVEGLVDLAALGKFTKDMNLDIDGLEYLKDIHKKGDKH